MAEPRDAAEVLGEHLERAYNHRDYWYLTGQRRDNVELAVAGFQIAWLRQLIHEVTGVMPPRRLRPGER